MEYRKCSVTKERMSEGYVLLEGDYYAKDEENLIKLLRSMGNDEYDACTDQWLLEEAYFNEVYYWTSWNE
jgi:hypothetical protein